MRGYEAQYTRNLRFQVLALLGGKCIRCGIDDTRVLQIDHIKGKGTQLRKTIPSRALYRDILNANGEGCQLLCDNCNWIKRSERNENPKQQLYRKREISLKILAKTLRLYGQL